MFAGGQCLTFPLRKPMEAWIQATGKPLASHWLRSHHLLHQDFHEKAVHSSFPGQKLVQSPPGRSHTCTLLVTMNTYFCGTYHQIISYPNISNGWMISYWIAIIIHPFSYSPKKQLIGDKVPCFLVFSERVQCWWTSWYDLSGPNIGISPDVVGVRNCSPVLVHGQTGTWLPEVCKEELGFVRD